MARMKRLAEYLKGVCPLYEDLDSETRNAMAEAGAEIYTDFVRNEGNVWYFECQDCGVVHEKTMPIEKDFVYIGSGPADDDSYDGYVSALTCHALIIQLRNTFGKEPVGARLYVKQESGYMEVVCEYDTMHPLSYGYAMMLEGNLPSKWSASAIRFLDSQISRD